MMVNCVLTDPIDDNNDDDDDDDDDDDTFIAPFNIK